MKTLMRSVYSYIRTAANWTLDESNQAPDKPNDKELLRGFISDSMEGT